MHNQHFTQIIVCIVNPVQYEKYRIQLDFYYSSTYSTDFFKDVAFHVSLHVKFGYIGCCDFSNNNPQNSCLVT